MNYGVIYAPRALRHLEAIYDYLADHAGPEIARRFTARLEEVCAKLATFPERGAPRNDIRPGLRTISFKRRAVIVFSVEGDVVVIHGVFYAGQDVEAAFDADELEQGD